MSVCVCIFHNLFVYSYFQCAHIAAVDRTNTIRYILMYIEIGTKTQRYSRLVKPHVNCTILRARRNLRTSYSSRPHRCRHCWLVGGGGGGGTVACVVHQCTFAVHCLYIYILYIYTYTYIHAPHTTFTKVIHTYIRYVRRIQISQYAVWLRVFSICN